VPRSIPQWPFPAFLSAFGHSYMQMAFGTRSQQGRMDAYVRSLMHVGPGADGWNNHCVSGAKLTLDHQDQGGWNRLMYNVRGSYQLNGTAGAPYVSNGGAFLLVWGINDLGFWGNTVQANTAYQHAMRACISRCRASTVYRVDYPNSAPISLGAGFASGIWAWNGTSGDNSYTSTATGGTNTVTITLPADFAGEDIAICWLWDATHGTGSGGVVTYSGTAGVTGTFDMRQMLPATATGFMPCVTRITNLTAAAAGQTIVATVTTLGTSGSVVFDSFWIESDTPPPVVVCNTARLLNNSAYSIFSAWSSSQVTADSDVETFNTYLTTLVAEFDGMVQIADLDQALSKRPAAYGTDGLHPSEWGAAACADAVQAAFQAMNSNSTWGEAALLQDQSPLSGLLTQPRVSGQWYAPDTYGGVNAAGTSEYTVTSGDVFAIPFFINSGITKIVQWSLTHGNTASSTAITVFFAIFDDRMYRGLPHANAVAPANGSPLSIGTTGTFTSTTTPGTNTGYISQALDLGLYWLILKIVAAGSPTAGTLRTIKGPSPYMPVLGSGGVPPASGGPCAWKATGLGTGVMPGTFMDMSLAGLPAPGGFAPVDNPPLVGLKFA